jgi:hypothetical protein
LSFVTDQRVWNVDNPEILEGHEGHYVHATAYVYPDHDSIHITGLKIPTASETKIDAMGVSMMPGSTTATPDVKRLHLLGQCLA